MSDNAKAAHICTYCGKTFNDRSHLVEHERIHTNEKPFCCTVCGKTFSLPGGLTRHMTTHIEDNRTYPCGKCGTSFATYYSLYKHRQLHRDFPHMCEICKVMYAAEDDLKKHLQSHKNEPCVYVCDTCNESFETNLLLEEHKDCHKACSLNENQQLHTAEDSPKKQHVCRFCKKSFQKIFALNRHISCTHAKAKGSNQPALTSAGSSQVRKSTEMSGKKYQYPLHAADREAPKQHVCKFCEKVFKTARGLNLHIHMHTKATAAMPAGLPQVQSSPDVPNKKYCCEICSNSFEDSYYLNQHKQMHQDRPFICDTCEETFVTVEDLSRHKQSDCSDSHICEVCSKSFSSAEVLQRHKIKHVLKRPFLCGVCLRSFNTARKLKDHLVSHVGKKSHTCRVCDKGFTTLHHLQEHQKICTTDTLAEQTPSATTMTNSPLGKTIELDKSTILTGTDGQDKQNKHFECSICGKSLHSAARLKEHKYVHSKERPFSCSKCGRAFKQLDTLKCHWRKHRKAHLQLSRRLQKQESNGAFSGGAKGQSRPLENTVNENRLTSPVVTNTENNVASGLQTAPNLATPPDLCLTADECPSHEVFDISWAQPQPFVGQLELAPLDNHLGAPSQEEESSTVTFGSFVCEICNENLDGFDELEVHRRSHDSLRSATSTFGEALNVLYEGASKSSIDHHTGMAVEKCDAAEDGIPELSDSDDNFGFAGLPDDTVDEEVKTSCANLLNFPDKIHEEHQPSQNTLSPSACIVPTGYNPSPTKDDSFISISGPFPCGKGLQLVIDKMQLFTCDICNRGFVTNAELDSHKMSHVNKLSCGEDAAENGSETDSSVQHVSDSGKSFQCRFCGKVCSHKARLMEHERVHTKEKPYKCSECSQAFSQGGTLRKHLAVIHKKELPRKKKAHLMRSVCCKDFKDISDSVQQLRVGSAEQAYKCDTCSNVYKHKTHLRLHKAICPGKGISSSIILSESTKASKNSKQSASSTVEMTVSGKSQKMSKTSKKYVDATGSLMLEVDTHSDAQANMCHNCGEVYKHKSDLNGHKCTGRLDPWSDESTTSNEASLESVVGVTSHLRSRHKSQEQDWLRVRRRDACTGRRVVNELFRCSICGSIFKEEHGLAAHMSTHSKVPPHNCDTSGRTYKNESHLKDHQDQCGGEKRKSCTPVEPRESKQSPLEKYAAIAKSTSEEAPVSEGQDVTMKGNYKCSVCGKVWPNMSKLVIHERSHKTDKPFKCGTCHRGYKHKHHLRDHQKATSCKVEESQPRKKLKTKKVHSLKGGRPQKSQSFTSKVSPGKDQESFRKKYSCSFCGKILPNRTSLERHEISHKTDRPYKCDTCHRAYKHKAHLADHKKKACKAKSLECDFCHKVFKLPYLMERHRVTHMEVKPFKCDKCGKSYKHKRVLKMHCENHHMSCMPPLVKKVAGLNILHWRAHLCSLCGQKFRSNSLLWLHRKRHPLKGRQIGCIQCGKMYQTGKGLRAHQLRRHTNTSLFEYGGLVGESQQIQGEEMGQNRATMTGGKLSVPAGEGCSAMELLQTMQPDLIEEISVQDAPNIKISHSSQQPAVLSTSEKVNPAVRRFGPLHVNHEQTIPVLPVTSHDADKVGSLNAEVLGIHKCSLCQQEFSSVSVLKKHRILHHERRYCCDVCYKTYLTAGQLKGHRTKTHANIKEFKCRFCAQEFYNRSDSVQHEKTHNAKLPFACDLCDSKFKSECHLQKHKEIQHPELAVDQVVQGQHSHSSRGDSTQSLQPLQTHSCSSCSKKCDSGYSLIKHLMSVHGQDEPSKPADSNGAREPAVQVKQQRSSPRRFQCKICGKGFLKKNAFTRHNKRHATETEPVSCHLCGKHFKVEHSLHRHKLMFHAGQQCRQILKPISYKDGGKCKLCGQEFPKKSLLSKHVSTSHANRHSYLCEYCGTPLPSYWRLKVHKHLMHPLGKTKLFLCRVCKKEFHAPHLLLRHSRIHQKKTFPCLVCGKTFNNARYLASHEGTHSAKAFMCDLCGKLLKTRASLRIHRTSHTDKKLFICEHCGKGFKTKSHLRSHRSRRCDENKEGNCKVCGRYFHDKRWLPVHMRSHRDKRRTCQVCNKVFKVQKYLTVHMRSHTNTRLYPCKFCPKTFITNSVLRDHMNIHLGLKPHKCKTCGASFASNGSLYHHFRVHKKQQTTAKRKAKGKSKRSVKE